MKRLMLILAGISAVAFAIVIIAFLQVDNNSTIDETPGIFATETPVNSNETNPPAQSSAPIIVPGSDAPVYVGYASTIEVDYVDPDYIKSQVIDKLFYIGYEDGQYTIVENDKYVSIRIVSSEEAAYKDLYEKLLSVIYESNVEQHKENGLPTDIRDMEIDSAGYYLTIYIYFDE